MIKSFINYSRGIFVYFTLLIIVGAVAKQFLSASFSEDPNPIWVLLLVLMVIYGVQIVNFALLYGRFLFSTYKIEGISRIKIIGSLFTTDLLIQLLVNLIFYRNLMTIGLSLLGFVVVLPFAIYWYLYTLCRLKNIKRSYFLSIIESSVMILIICVITNPKLWIFIILGITILLSYAYFIFILLRKTDR